MTPRPRFSRLTAWALAFLAAGCAAGVSQKSPPQEVRAFFLAAHEANFLGLSCFSPTHVDLSAYSHLLGVKYPPTAAVEVLTAPPARPYQAFAVLTGARPEAAADTGSLIEKFRDKARTLGADAIVLCQPGGTQGAAALEAVAIKYEFEPPRGSPKDKAAPSP
jgi:hypothetical protein